jgi:general secretion pathway protein G/type IV pilus assembly protein PilA
MELAIVLVIVGVVAAIAVPRLSSAVSNAKNAGVLANVRSFKRAIDMYIEEHDGRNPAQLPDRSIDNAPGQFKNRLLKRTKNTGIVDAVAGLYGPYLSAIPVNPMNGQSTVRIAGAPPGNGSGGWWFDPVTAELLADDSAASAAATKK